MYTNELGLLPSGLKHTADPSRSLEAYRNQTRMETKIGRLLDGPVLEITSSDRLDSDSARYRVQY